MSMNEYIPADFSPLADWDHRNRANNDGHSVAWKTLSDALKAGEIPGFKLSNGRWYVHEAKANEFLAKSKATPVETPVLADDSRIEAGMASLASIDTTLDEIYRVLERLTAAVESIATQSKTAQQEVLATMSSNGFHN